MSQPDTEEQKRRGAKVQQQALEGVEGLLRKLNLCEQPITVRGYPGKRHTRTLILPWGRTIDPPAEAYYVGRLLRQVLSEDQLRFMLEQALTTSDEFAPRTEPRAFSHGYHYFLSMGRALALGDDSEPGTCGSWAAIAVACASLVRWTGADIVPNPLRDPRWRERFDDQIARLVEDVADGAVALGSERLREIMRELEGLDRCVHPDFRLDGREVSFRGKSTTLPFLQAEILKALKAGRSRTIAELLDEAWGEQAAPDGTEGWAAQRNKFNVQLKRLRDELKAAFGDAVQIESLGSREYVLRVTLTEK